MLTDYGWYRIDPRGNREDIDARFDPPTEHLAFEPRRPGEADLPVRFAEPLTSVVEALGSSLDARSVSLPDAPSDMAPPTNVQHL